MTDESPLLEVVDVQKLFPLTRSITETFSRTSRRSVHAVDGVSITVGVGETLGLIGESGSGKTTLGWLVSRLHEPTVGAIRFEGKDITHLGGEELRAWRRHVQVVFQDPVGSLDPRLRVWQIVGEPIRAQNFMDRRNARLERRRVRRQQARLHREYLAARRKGTANVTETLPPLPAVPLRLTTAVVRQRVKAMLPTVGLPVDCLDQYPHEFSGGGRQRLSLARALIVNPRLIILDEPTSALDVAVQAQILNRLLELQRERNVAYLLITHNVAAVRFAADRVAVMYLGQVVEYSTGPGPVGTSGPSVHEGTARRGSPARPRSEEETLPDQGRHPILDRPPARVPVRASLPVRAGPVSGVGPAPRGPPSGREPGRRLLPRGGGRRRPAGVVPRRGRPGPAA